jgi:hypothetical protein
MRHDKGAKTITEKQCKLEGKEARLRPGQKKADAANIAVNHSTDLKVMF